MNEFELLIYLKVLQLQDSVNGISGGGGSSNPTGGTVNVATINYQTTLLQQFISENSGSSSAQLVNLINSQIETWNLESQTFLALNYASTVNANNDDILAIESASGSRGVGLINPAHLRLISHFDGTGIVPSSIVSADSPIYNSNNGAVAKLNINNNVVILPSNSTLYAESLFIGGTPSSSAGTAANAFDGNTATSCSCFVSGNSWIEYDLGSGNSTVLKSFLIHATAAVTGVFVQGSNDNSTWINLNSISVTLLQNNSTLISTTNITSYRYYRMFTAQTALVVNISLFMGFNFYLVANYDTINYKLGTSSVNLPGTAYLSGVAQNVNQLQLGILPWQIRGYFNFTTSPGTSGSWMTLFTLPNQIEIQATSTGLQVRYSQDGSTFTVASSSSFSWTTSTWYYISVRLTGTTLFFYVNGVAQGSVSLSGVNLFSTASNSFFVGSDSTNLNLLNGNIDELEIWIAGNSPNLDTAPLVATTTAQIPAIDWGSASNFISTSVSTINVVFMLDEITFSSFGVPVIGTDWFFQVSLDNGSTWHNVSLTKLSALTTLTYIYIGSLSLTGITNTNQFKYQITSNAGKVMKCDGLIIYWS